MERNTDYEITKQNVTQFPSILWEKFNFFIQTGSTEDYKHSSYCHFDAYNELNSQNILLYSCDLVSRRYFGFCRMLRSRHEMNSRHDFDKKIKKIALDLYCPLLQLVKLMPWVRLMPWLWLWPYVRIMPWGELMAWLRQKNKKDSPWLVLSSPAIGETHAMSSTHAMALALAVC